MKTQPKTMREINIKLVGDKTIKQDELRVFFAWSQDQASFSACSSVIKDRVPHMSIKNIQRAFKNLVKKGYLIDAGYKTTRNKVGELVRYKAYEINENMVLQEKTTEIEDPFVNNPIDFDEEG